MGYAAKAERQSLSAIRPVHGITGRLAQRPTFDINANKMPAERAPLCCSGNIAHKAPGRRKEAILLRFAAEEERVGQSHIHLPTQHHEDLNMASMGT